LAVFAYEEFGLLICTSILCIFITYFAARICNRAKYKSGNIQTHRKKFIFHRNYHRHIRFTQ